VRCIVTAGPTFEPLDEVRRLTNFSSGRLGTELANYLSAHGHQVTLMVGAQAVWAGPRRVERVVVFTTTDDLRRKLEALNGDRVGAVFHAAAVSDYAFGKIWRRGPSGRLARLRAGKIRSREGVLLAELCPTPKLISYLRGWFPQACLVGWKYEVDGNREQALARARLQIVENRTDGCVANGPACGRGFALVTKEGRLLRLKGPLPLFAALEDLLHRVPASRWDGQCGSGRRNHA
jgi:phosphopantothenate---cysteine ligase (CTP)